MEARPDLGSGGEITLERAIDDRREGRIGTRELGEEPAQDRHRSLGPHRRDDLPGAVERRPLDEEATQVDRQLVLPELVELGLDRRTQAGSRVMEPAPVGGGDRSGGIILL